MMKKRPSILAMTVVFVLSMANASLSAEYPTKAITLINPWSAGGSTDAMGRAWASAAGRILGKPVVVLNKTGGGGMVGGLAATQAPPDGYTLFLDASAIRGSIAWEVVNGRKPPLTGEDLIPIGSYVFDPAVVVVPSNSPWKTLKDMIAECKAKPGQYAFCSGGLYGGSHLPAELLMMAAGLKARHVPFEGGNPCLLALVGEHFAFSTQWPPTSIPLIRGGKLRALAVMGKNRLKPLPDVPTTKELGIDAEWHQWVGLTVSKQTPMAIVEKLRKIAKQVAEDESYIKIQLDMGGEVNYMNSDELAEYINQESKMLLKLLKKLLEESK